MRYSRQSGTGRISGHYSFLVRPAAIAADRSVGTGALGPVVTTMTRIGLKRPDPALH
jgi:hypothetical protein